MDAMKSKKPLGANSFSGNITHFNNKNKKQKKKKKHFAFHNFNFVNTFRQLHHSGQFQCLKINEFYNIIIKSLELTE